MTELGFHLQYRVLCHQQRVLVTNFNTLYDIIDICKTYSQTPIHHHHYMAAVQSKVVILFSFLPVLCYCYCVYLLLGLVATKPVFGASEKSETQISLLSNIDLLEN